MSPVINDAVNMVRVCGVMYLVVTSRELRKSKDDSIWVMPDADQVCTRFFFV